MKKVLLFLILFGFNSYPVESKADFVTGMIIGSAISGGTKTVIKNVDEFSKMVEVIDHRLSTEIFDNKHKVVSISLDGFNVKAFETYYRAKNYDVAIEDKSTLIFNLSKEIKQQNEHDKEAVRAGLVLACFLIGFTAVALGNFAIGGFAGLVSFGLILLIFWK